MKARYGNCLTFYGGGLCDPANYYITGLENRLVKSGLFDEVFVGFYSFRCLTEEGLIKKWSDELAIEATNAHGGFFGTARNTNLVDTMLMQKAIERCKSYNIKWVFIGGGDGSARQVNEIADSFQKEGIHFVFTMPLTIDGINGGESIGINSAVRASLSLIEQVCSTTLRTLDGNKFPWITFELQGRNRDDILISVLKEMTTYRRIGDFDESDVQVIALPTNLSWKPEDLRRIMKNTNTKSYHGILRGVPTVILLSEGAQIGRREIKKMGEEEQIKIRSFEIGHYSQMNSCTTDDDRKLIDAVLDKTAHVIEDMITFEKPYTIVFENLSTNKCRVDDISFFGVNNPRDGKYSFSTADNLFLRKFIPNEY